MGGGHFNLNQATKAVKHAASSTAHTAFDLANPINYLPKPAEGRSRGDQERRFRRFLGEGSGLAKRGTWL